jgi:hypothetical protein
MSKRIGSQHYSSRSADWIDVKIPASPGVKREAEHGARQMAERRFPLPRTAEVGSGPKAVWQVDKMTLAFKAWLLGLILTVAFVLASVQWFDGPVALWAYDIFQGRHIAASLGWASDVPRDQSIDSGNDRLSSAALAPPQISALVEPRDRVVIKHASKQRTDNGPRVVSVGASQ